MTAVPARAALLVAAGVLAPAVLAAVPAVVGQVVVNQANRAFSVREVTVKRGEVVRFSNADEFVHHIFVSAPAFSFDSGEQPPGRDVAVPFTVPGTFEVQCEIHPRMHLTVSVQ